MAPVSEGDRQAKYQSDVDIINRRADERKTRLETAKAAADAKEQAAVDKLIAAKQAHRDKRKAGIKAEWDQKLAAVRPGQEYKKPVIDEQFDGLSDLADLEYDNWFDMSSEQQYKKDGRAMERHTKALAAVEKWRLNEIGKEASQLASGLQRQRR